jgi:hypothetical protein
MGRRHVSRTAASMVVSQVVDQSDPNWPDCIATAQTRWETVFRPHQFGAELRLQPVRVPAISTWDVA